MPGLSEGDKALLEVIKTIASIAMPIVVVVVGMLVTRSVKRLEGRMWFDQKLIEKRIKVYEELAPLLNDLHCFFCRVGHWKQMSAEDVVSTKRKADKVFYVNQFLFSETFQSLYFDYMLGICFKPYPGHGRDAWLRASPKLYAGVIKDWKNEETERFADDAGNPDDDRRKRFYEMLMNRFSTELGVRRESSIELVGKKP